MAEVARTLVVSEGAVRVPLELLPELQPGESYCAQREGAAGEVPVDVGLLDGGVARLAFASDRVLDLDLGGEAERVREGVADEEHEAVEIELGGGVARGRDAVVPVELAVAAEGGAAERARERRRLGGQLDGGLGVRHAAGRGEEGEGGERGGDLLHGVHFLENGYQEKIALLARRWRCQQRCA